MRDKEATKYRRMIKLKKKKEETKKPLRHFKLSIYEKQKQLELYGERIFASNGSLFFKTRRKRVSIPQWRRYEKGTG